MTATDSASPPNTATHEIRASWSYIA